VVSRLSESGSSPSLRLLRPLRICTLRRTVWRVRRPHPARLQRIVLHTMHAVHRAAHHACSASCCTQCEQARVLAQHSHLLHVLR
jgi:hypothetical protein